MMFTYSDDLFSDLHKDVYGFRPRGARMDEWNERTPRQKQELWNALCDELEENEKAARKAEAEALDEFRITLREVMDTCSCNWKKAVKFLAEAEKIDLNRDEQDFDYFLWNQGIGFNDRQNIYKLYKEAA